jgi:hypothetical protein
MDTAKIVAAGMAAFRLERLAMGSFATRPGHLPPATAHVLGPWLPTFGTTPASRPLVPGPLPGGPTFLIHLACLGSPKGG